jgi:ParB family chromosome partitioning protein
VKKGLGRGLGALLDNEREEKKLPAANTGVIDIDIRKLEPNRQQPRQYFSEESLAEMAESIHTYGIIQPLIVKKTGDFYQIIAGERRYRAARMAKLETVPAIVKDYSDIDILQIALIENIQRQDLTPIEEAACYRRLMDDYFFSLEDISLKVGKNKHAIGNMLCLLELDGRVQALAAENQLTASHGRVLLAVKDGDTQLGVARQIIENDLSVRQTEILIKNTVKEAPIKMETPEDVAAAYRRTEDDLKKLLGSKVTIRPGKKKGRIEIEYYSNDELDRLVSMIKRMPVHTNPTMV